MVIDDLIQHPIISTLNNTPTADEIHGTIEKMKNNKDPGLSGVMMDIIRIYVICQPLSKADWKVR